MFKSIPEPDWKTFKKIRENALERFSQRTIDRCLSILNNETLTAHERYTQTNKFLDQQNIEMSRAFDDFRRSTAINCLCFMHSYDLLTEEEISEFSPEVQSIISIEL